MKICIYTCIVGDYDKGAPWIAPSNNFAQKVLFTDQQMPQNCEWEIRELYTPESIEMRPDLINRRHKIFPESILNDIDVSVYIDGNIDVTADIYALVDEFVASDALFGCLKHPQRDKMAEEADTCRKLSKFKGDDEERLSAQLANMASDGFPEEHPIFAAGVLFRRHNQGEELKEAMSLWWSQVTEYTCRDQISLPYVLWKTQLKYTVFDIDIFDNPFFRRKLHASRRTLRDWLGVGLKSIRSKATTISGVSKSRHEIFK